MTIPRLISYSLPKKNELPNNKVDWIIDINRCSLLIHDMQEYFISFFDKKNYQLQNFIENIILLKNFCNINNIPVIYTIQPYQNNKNRALLNDIWGNGLNNFPIIQQKIINQLTPNSKDIIIKKNRYSAFYLTSLESNLKNINRNQLIITGVYAHIGCLVTCIESFMRDIKPFMVADAMGAFNLQEHIMTLNYAAKYSAKVLMTQDIILIPLSKQDLRNIIISLLEDNNIIPKDDENLIDYGINSIQIMELASKWNIIKKDVNFMNLAKNPTVNHWWFLLSKV